MVIVSPFEIDERYYSFEERLRLHELAEYLNFPEIPFYEIEDFAVKTYTEKLLRVLLTHPTISTQDIQSLGTAINAVGKLPYFLPGINFEITLNIYSQTITIHYSENYFEISEYAFEETEQGGKDSYAVMDYICENFGPKGVSENVNIVSWIESLTEFLNVGFINSDSSFELRDMTINKTLLAVVDEVLDIVYSSERVMPAHYSSSKDNTQSFMIDFKLMSKEDEYNMASIAFYETPTTVAFEELGVSIEKDDYCKLIKAGEDFMLGSYIATKLNYENFLADIYKNILTESLDFGLLTSDYVKLPCVKQYFEHCSSVGHKIATGTLN